MGTASPIHATFTILLVAGLMIALAAPASASLVTLDAAADATAWNSQRKVVRDSAGRLYAALRVLDIEIGGAVLVFRLDEEGDTWSPLPRIPGVVDEMRPGSLAIDSTDHVHLAWAERAVENLQIFHAAWTGARWTPRTQVSETPGYSGFPAIAVDLQNRLHVAWYGYDGYTYQVYYRVRATEGTWGPTETVSAGLEDANNPALAIGPDGRPHVAWFLFAGARLSVVYTSRGGSWGTAATLSDLSTHAINPSLAVDSGGRVFVTWTERYSNGTFAVVTRFHDTVDWSGPTVLAWFSVPGGHPVMALDGQDRAFVFWDQSDDAIRYRVFNASWGQTFTLPSNGTASFPSVRWATVANPLFTGVNLLDVAWTEEVDGAYSVVLSGVPVASTGQRPTVSSGPEIPLLLAAGFVLGGVLWLIYRRNRLRARKP